MRNRLVMCAFLVVMAIVLAACGEQSKEDVVKEVGDKWTESKGYELDAQMEIKTGSEPRVYDVNVWHTKPELYRVKVSQQGDEASQMIVRNKDGVFVVTPSLNKTYKFQSEWPKQNSQAYLIGALAEDMKADSKASMKEQDQEYVIETKTRNNHSKMLPYQQIFIDKKTMLPTKVLVLNEAKEEQISITFKKITLGKAHKEEEFAVKEFIESKKDDKKTASAEIENPEFQTAYPVLKWDGMKMDEKVVKEDGKERIILTYSGKDKSFTVIQQPVAKQEESYLPVFAPGDPADLGFTIGAITDKSISWEKNGVSYFIASSKLTRDEMIEVAASMVKSGKK